MLHGNHIYLLQNNYGPTIDDHSITAVLDYTDVGPEHAWLRDIGRVGYQPILDEKVLEVFQLIIRIEKASSRRSNPPMPLPMR